MKSFQRSIIGVGVLLVLVAAGCKGGSATTQEPSDGPAKAVEESTSKPLHDGADYFGLRDGLVMQAELTGATSSKQSGTVRVKKLPDKDGHESYEIIREGDLAGLGTDTVEVRPEGVFNTGNTILETDAPSQELPAHPESGTKWKTELKAKANGQEVRGNMEFVVRGTESITISGKTMDALVVDATGAMKMGGQSLKMKSTSWYCRQLGLVRQTYEMTGATGTQTSEFTVTSL